MKLVAKALLGLCLLSGSASAQPESFGAFVVDAGRPDVLLLDGAIAPMAALDMFRALARYPGVRTLELNSSGGEIAEALILAGFIHDRKFTTVVPSGARCVSECAFLFFAGHVRTVSGVLGLNQSRLGNLSAVGIQTQIARILNTLFRVGVPDQAIVAMLQFPPDLPYLVVEEDEERLAFAYMPDAATPLPPAPPVEGPPPAPDEDRTNGALLARLANADVLEGERAAGVCRACHTVAEGAGNRTGPNLFGVVYGGVGAVEGFDYSRILRELNAAGAVWTYNALDAYLRDRQGPARGSIMRAFVIEDAIERANLIAFLRLLTDNATPPLPDAASPRPILDELRIIINGRWNPPGGWTNPSDIGLTLRIRLNPDGTVAAMPIVVRAAESQYAAAAVDAAIRAVYLAAPFSFLPVERYEEWREVEIRFNGLFPR